MRNQITSMRENLMWTRSGTTWAIWRLSPEPYGFGAEEDKELVMLHHQAMFQSIHGESLLLGFCADLDPASVVEKMIAGVDLSACSQYLEEVELTLAELESMPVGERAFWLAAPLPERSSWGKAKASLRAADAQIRSQLALPARYPAEDEIQAYQMAAQNIEEMIPGAFRPCRATPAEVAWIVAHCHSRGLGIDPGVPSPGPTSDPSVHVAGSVLCDPWLDEGAVSDQTGLNRYVPVGRRYVKVASEATDDLPSYQVLMAMAGTPKGGFSFPGGEFVAALDKLPVDADFALRITATPAEKAKSRNKRAETKLAEEYGQQEGNESITGGRSNLDETTRDLAAYHQALNASEKEVEIQATFLIAVGAPTADQATAKARYISRYYGEKDFRLLTPLGHQEELWWSMQPGVPLTPVVKSLHQVTTGADFAMGVPLVSDALGDPSGFRIGDNISAGRRSPVYMNLAGMMENDSSGSFGITGENGSGKSTFLKIIAGNVYDRSGQVIVIDRSDNMEWAALGQLLTGSEGSTATVVDVNDPAWSLDPLRMFEPRTASRMVQSLFAVMLGIQPMSPLGSLLGRILQPEYTSQYQITSLGALQRHLESDQGVPGQHRAESSQIAYLMNNISSTDLGDVLFAPELPPLDLSSRFIVFCTHGVDLPNREELHSETLKRELPVEKIFGRGLYSLLVSISKTIGFADDSQESLFIVDEAHHATGSPETEKEISDGIRYGRKHKFAVGLGSHDAESDFGSPQLRALIPLRFVFRTRDADLAGRNLNWLGKMDQDQWRDLVTTDLSPHGPDGVPADRRGECLMRDARGQIGKIQVLLPRSPLRAQAVLTTPPKRSAPSALAGAQR